jgi:hypothetical protein
LGGHDAYRSAPERFFRSKTGYNPVTMLALEKTFLDALLHAIENPSEEAKHMATESLRDLLGMYQEDTLKKVAAMNTLAASAEA